jgi:acetyl esterase/lipase
MKSIFGLILLVFSLTLSAPAQQPAQAMADDSSSAGKIEPLPTLPPGVVLHDPVPFPPGFREKLGPDAALADAHKAVVYATVDGQPLLLDLYVPKQAAKPIPLLIWIHGGGMRAGSRTFMGGRIFPFIPLGYAVATIDYRLAPGTLWPGMLYDCKAAVRYLRAHAADYGYDPKRFAVAGDSAGGILSAMIGATGDRPEFEGNEGTPGVSSAVQAAAPFFGGYDFTDVNTHATPQKLASVKFWLGVSPPDDLAKARTASAVYYLDSKTPPFFVAHGTGDKTAPFIQSVDLDRALTKAGVPHETYFIKGAPHEFGDQGCLDALIAFLNKYLRPGQP